MKDLLLRAGVTAVGLAGIVTVVVVVRLVFTSAPPTPTGEAHPLELAAPGAVERVRAALAVQSGAGSDELARHLEEAFPRIHEALEVELLDAGAVLYTWTGADRELPPVLLAVHGVDPAGEDPEGEEMGEVQASDGELRGPGARGGRAMLVATLEAVDALLAEGHEPRRTIHLVAGRGKGAVGPGGGSDIAKALEERGIRPAWVLVGGSESGTGLTTGLVPGVVDPVALVGVAERGRVEVELRMAGDASTGAGDSVPEEAAVRQDSGAAAAAPPTRRYGRVEIGPMGRRGSAAEARVAEGPPAGLLAQAVARLLEPFDARIEGPGRELLETMAPHMDPGTRMLIRNLWLFRGPVERALAQESGSMELVRTTAVATLIRAGNEAAGDQSAGSQGAGSQALPPLARVHLYLAPWESVEGALEVVRGRLRGLGVEVSVRELAAPPLAPDPARSPGPEVGYRGDGFHRIRDAVHHTFPDVVAVTPGVALTPTAGRHFRELSDAVYRFSPLRIRVPEPEPAGSRAESLPERQYLDMVRFYAELIRRSDEGP